MKPILLLVLLVTSPLLSMELAISSQILLPPDIIKLIAYALVDTTQQCILVDHPSCSRKVDKQLLVTLQNFSATNKKIHDIIYNLRCGIDEEAIRFNRHFYIRMGWHVTTAAFMGTPWALSIIDKRFKELHNKYDKETAIKEFNKLLGVRSEPIALPIQIVPNVSFRNFHPIFRINNNRTPIEPCYESITNTMAKFPQSTRQCILNLMS